MSKGPPKKSDSLKTAEQVRKDFQEAGVSIGGWAKRHGYDRAAVYSVLAGRAKGAHGKTHEIAVALGMKAGRIVDPAKFCTPQREAA